MVQNAYFQFNSSIIPDNDTINSATIYFYANSYTASRGVTKTYKIWIRTQNEFTNILATPTQTFTTAGWYAIKLNAGVLQHIDVGASGNDNRTQMMITVPNPNIPKSRSMRTSAKENVFGVQTAYLLINHSAPIEPPVVETVTIEEEGYWFMGMMLNVMFFVGFLSVYYLKKYKNEWE